MQHLHRLSSKPAVWRRPKACDQPEPGDQPNYRGNNSVSKESEKTAVISATQLLPRFVRFRDAPFYVGMDRNRFNTEVRPYLTNIPVGRQGLAFDRLELDAWVEDYKSRNGRRPKAPQPEDDTCQNVTVCRGFARRAGSGTSKNAAGTQHTDGSGNARAHLAALRQNKP